MVAALEEKTSSSSNLHYSRKMSMIISNGNNNIKSSSSTHHHLLHHHQNLLLQTQRVRSVLIAFAREHHQELNQVVLASRFGFTTMAVKIWQSLISKLERFQRMLTISSSSSTTSPS